MAMTTEKVWAALDSLLRYAKDCELLHPLDETFARNSLLAELKLESYEKQKEHYEFPECLNVVLEFKDLNVEAFGFSQRHDLFENFGCRTGSDADAEFLEIPGISGKSGAARKNGGKRQQCGCQCDVAAFHSVGSSLFFDMGRTFEYRAVAVLMKCSLCTARPI